MPASSRRPLARPRLVSSLRLRASTTGSTVRTPRADATRPLEVRNSGGRVTAAARGTATSSAAMAARLRAASAEAAAATASAEVDNAAAEAATRDGCGRANRRGGRAASGDRGFTGGRGTGLAGATRAGESEGSSGSTATEVVTESSDPRRAGTCRASRSSMARTAASILDPRSDRPRVYAATRSRRAHPVAVGSMVSCARIARGGARAGRCDATSGEETSSFDDGARRALVFVENSSGFENARGGLGHPGRDGITAPLLRSCGSSPRVTIGVARRTATPRGLDASDLPRRSGGELPRARIPAPRGSRLRCLSDLI
jgi:hypothetical protein